MSTEEIKLLSPGIYIIEWKHSGGVSAASIGILHNGDRWMAPANWTNEVAAGCITSNSARWEDIEQVTLILSSSTLHYINKRIG